MSAQVNTVLGPIGADELGVVAIHEALLSVVPGAQFAYDITIDRAEIFDILASKLRAFKAAGGGTIVDRTGMFHGRDLPLYEALSRSTGVHIVASTGMGPEENLGGYFLTPQTNPPTPWPAERFAELFAAEATDGMVHPRVARRAPAGLIVTTQSSDGATPTDDSLLRGAALAATRSGVALAFSAPSDTIRALELALAEGLPADRIVVSGLDRAGTGATVRATARAVAKRGAYIALDHIGRVDAGSPSDDDRAALVLALVDAGHGARILLSAGAVGVAKGHAEVNSAYEVVLTDFAPKLAAHGLDEDGIRRILIDNPRDLLAVKEA
ncbi:phosphotriesterase family protein [Microterricola pindariensis]|uniref:Aryldialkylphosphatase n=1 Tax=Microterricola pindariensis TaxID=478010 RepID=A0ABX5AY27_9MICO|nr:phosphotriesterase [Microterricola pindariensis]PPL19445.1 aryldialkylphosphatase [Microterricola pindariensis]